MTTSNLYGIQAININGTAYAGARGQTFDRKREFIDLGSDGTVQETFHAIAQQKADISYTTVAMKTMLAAMGTSGTAQFPFVLLDGVNGVQMICAQALGSAPGYQASALHVSKTALAGLVVMESVRWSTGQAAEMTCRAFGLSSNGTSDPWVTSATQALPTQSLNTQAMALTALTLNGVSVGTLQSFELSVDHKFSYDFTTGLPYPMNISGAGPKGPAAIRLMADVADASMTEGTGAVSAVFTSFTQSGALTGTTTTFTITGGWTLEDTITTSSSGPGTKRLTVRPYYNGTTLPLTWV